MTTARRTAVAIVAVLVVALARVFDANPTRR